MESEFSARLCSDKWQSIEKERVGEGEREGGRRREEEIKSATRGRGQLPLPKKNRLNLSPFCNKYLYLCSIPFVWR